MGLRVRRLTARCPQCGTPPRIRPTELTVLLLNGQPRNSVWLTYQCHKELAYGSICGTVYEIRIRDFVQADLVRDVEDC